MGTKHDRQAVFRLLKLISAALIALIVILVFTNLSSFSGVFRALIQVLSSVLYGFLFAYLLNPLVRGLEQAAAAVPAAARLRGKGRLARQPCGRHCVCVCGGRHDGLCPDCDDCAAAGSQHPRDCQQHAGVL